MKKPFRIVFIVVGGLVVAGLAAYRIWFYNPYEDTLRLDPGVVFSDEASSDRLLIRNATLIDVVAGEALQNAHVLIRGETIANVFADEEPEVPAGTQVYDARNKFVMPGLFDMHVHLAMHWHLISGDFGPRDALATRAALEQFVRYGVTTVLAHGGGGTNDDQAVELKRLARGKAIVAPWLFATGNIITAPASHPITTIMRLPPDTSPARLHRAGVSAVTEADDIAGIVLNKRRRGLDGVKIVIESGPPPWYPNPRMSVETAAAIIEHAGRHALPVYAHTESLADFADAVRLGVRAIMHSVMDTPIEGSGLIQRMQQQGIWYIPALSIFHGFQSLGRPERLEDEFLIAGVSRRTLRGLEHPLFRFGFGRSLSGFDISGWLNTSMRNLASLHRAGVPVALGTDASTPFNFPGYGAHVEMELMARAGLSNADVLRIATVNGATFLGIDDQVGTIGPGKFANLLVLERNPLTDIRNTRSLDRVILKGRLIDPIGRAEAN
jgi:imidazolonepropionase-like amidohydrolase